MAWFLHITLIVGAITLNKATKIALLLDSTPFEAFFLCL